MMPISDGLRDLQMCKAGHERLGMAEGCFCQNGLQRLNLLMQMVDCVSDIKF